MHSPIENLDQLLRDARGRERQLLFSVIAFLMRNVSNRKVRRCSHFVEWFRIPMNYARIMELPLTDILLDVKPDDRILDVSSPKLLAFLYGLKPKQRLVAADLEEYFVGDFETFMSETDLSLETNVFDASSKIPYPDESFDKVFSVSVLEHIADTGDGLAFDEIYRVLAPGGVAVITLPVYSEYLEEWTTNRSYWRTKQDNDNQKFFFQRRYDLAALEGRLRWNSEHKIEYVLVAENPIRPLELPEGGRLRHNSYLMDEQFVPRMLRKLGRVRYLPLLRYFAERSVSSSSHYLTTDWADPNIRQIVYKVTKPATNITAGHRVQA